MAETVTEILLTETFANPAMFAERYQELGETGWECDANFNWNDGKFHISYWKPVKEIRQ